MELPKVYTQLEFNSEGLKSLAQQIRKDFGRSGLVWPENCMQALNEQEQSLDKLKRIVHSALISVLKSGQDLKPMLYIVDIPEKKWSALMGNQEHSITSLAELIVLREGIKVIIREAYS